MRDPWIGETVMMYCTTRTNNGFVWLSPITIGSMLLTNFLLYNNCDNLRHTTVLYQNKQLINTQHTLVFVNK